MTRQSGVPKGLLLIQNYNFVIMCHFCNCSVGNNHFKVFYDQLGQHRSLFHLCVWTMGHLHSVCASVTLNKDNKCRRATCTASTQRLGTDFLLTQSESMSYWHHSLRQSCHCSGVLYSSVLFVEEDSLWLPENDWVSIMFPHSMLHTRFLLSSDNYSKRQPMCQI